MREKRETCADTKIKVFSDECYQTYSSFDLVSVPRDPRSRTRFESSGRKQERCLQERSEEERKEETVRGRRHRFSEGRYRKGRSVDEAKRWEKKRRKLTSFNHSRLRPPRTS